MSTNLQESINHLINFMDLGWGTNPEGERHAKIEAYLDGALDNGFDKDNWNRMVKTLVHIYIVDRRDRGFETIRNIQNLIAQEEDELEIAENTKLIRTTLDEIDELPALSYVFIDRLTRKAVTS